VATIFPHLGAVLASGALSPLRLSAAAQAATQGAGTTALVIMILIGAVLAAVGQAVRALVALAAAFLQVAAAMASLLIVTGLSAFVIVILLIHP